MTNNELADLPIEVLEAALRSARDREAEREAKEAKARWPKCKCGQPVAQICYPRVSYVFRHVFDRSGRATVGYEDSDEQESAPGSCEIDENVAWGACDDENCIMNEWALISANDISWG
jgi:hypothetical protein